MNLRRLPTREFDFLLAMSALALVAYGTALIYSGSLNNYGSPAETLAHPVVRQAAFAAVGLAAMLLLARVDYRVYGPLSATLYVLSIGALLFVLAVGSSEYGARRWIDVGGTQVQPSEFAKITTAIMLAKFFADNEQRMDSPRVFFTSMAIVALPAALVLVEPDLGSSLTFGAMWLGMAVVAGVRLTYVGGLLLVAGGLGPLLLREFAHGYQLERIRVWLDPESDAAGAGFNILQATISIGSGGLWGKGFTEGSQTQLDYLRTQTTDYIFSVAAEELGFVGVMVLFALFLIVLFRCLRIASLADDPFGRLIAVGVLTVILYQTFVNIGVNIRLLPVTGVPLPLVSLGGSSLIAVLASLGILQSILGHRRRRGRRA